MSNPIDLAPNNPYGLSLATPVLAAAGCFGYGVEYARGVDLARIGAIVTRSTTLHGRRAARPPRLVETPAGVLCVGRWPDPGVAHVVERLAPVWAGWATPVLLSIAGESPAEYAAVVAALEGVEGIAGVELSLAGVEDQALAITAATRAATQLPLLVKLPPQEGLVELALALVAAGADALTLVGSPRGLVIDEHGERLEGRLSGPALRPLALRHVAEVAAAVAVPVVGCGGIASTADARQFLAAGAAAVQVGAALLADPAAAARIGAELYGGGQASEDP